MRPWIIAHRGASHEAPENTLEAVRLAALLGADAAEIDVRPSADGVPIVLHDASLDRTTNGTGPARERTYDEIRRLSAGYPKRFGDRYHDAYVPTFAEVLALARELRLRLAIEIKTEQPEPELVREVVEQVASADMVERVWIWSFLWQNLAAVRRHSKEIPRGALSLGFPRAELRAQSELLVPFAAHLLLVDLGFALRDGKPVFTWTVNQPWTARRLAAKGSRGIITDRPERMVGLFG